MALSPYKGIENPLNRSRSSSCSSPLRNRIVYQEIYSIGTNTLFRSYSCSHVFDKDENGDPIQTTQIQFSSFITPEKKFCNSESRKIKTEPKKYELNSSKPNIRKNAKKQLKMIEEPKKKHKRSIWKYLIWILLPILMAVALHLYTIHLECTRVWDLELTKNQLKENVYGQDVALDKINLFLNRFNNSGNMVTMVWTGGVGVGKTFTSSIISENFPWRSNKVITLSDSYHAGWDEIILNDFASCGYNLLIVDDIPPKYTTEALNLIGFLQTKLKGKEKLLVILIFSTHSENDQNSVIDEFKNSSVDFFHVPFKSLDEKAVRKCFHNEIKRQNVIMSIANLNILVREKMKAVNVVNGLIGCKGVADEVSAFYQNSRK